MLEKKEYYFKEGAGEYRIEAFGFLARSLPVQVKLKTPISYDDDGLVFLDVLKSKVMKKIIKRFTPLFERYPSHKENIVKFFDTAFDYFFYCEKSFYIKKNKKRDVLFLKTKQELVYF